VVCCFLNKFVAKSEAFSTWPE